LWGKTGVAVKQALEKIEARIPFRLTHLYFDNGCEFLNEDVIRKYANTSERKIIVQRSRPYRKNDQCYVEQKNYTHVRTLFGYGRIDWKIATRLMNNVYRGTWREIQNFYCPQQQLIEKNRIGSRVVRKMSHAETPYQRLRPFMSEDKAAILDEQMKKINPFISMKRVRAAVRNIFGYFKNSMGRQEWGKVVR